MTPEMVSIITPVYNAESSLDKMISSVKAQEYSNWQLILVDDGSVDRSAVICDRYAEDDKRIVVIHQKNAGVAIARNRALQACQGEYIAFCDSDDWYEQSFLSELIRIENQTKADLCVGGLYVDRDGCSERYKVPLTGTFQKEQFMKIYSQWFDIYWMGLWNKLFRAELVQKHQLRFTENLRMGEDSLFILDYLEHSEVVSCSDRPIYHYVQHSESSLTHGFNPDRFRGCVLVTERLKRAMEKNGAYDTEAESMLTARRAEALSAYVYTAMMSTELTEKQKKSVFEELKQSRRERKLMKRSHALTTRIIGSAPYPILKAYMRLLAKRHMRSNKAK